MSERAEVRAVAWAQQGSDIAVDAAIGALSIVVSNPVDFDEDGGTLSIGGIEYDYTAADMDSGTLTLASALTAAATAGDWCSVIAGGIVAIDYLAYCSLGDGDEVEVPIPYAERDLWPEGEYAAPVLVELADDLESIVAVPGRTPLRDGSFLDPTTIPAPPTSDGIAPTSSPTPTVIGGIGAFFLRWVPPANADPLRFEVHVSGTSGFTPDSTTKQTETSAYSATLRTLPQLDALGQPQPFSYGVPYYFRIVAKDVDGSAPPGSESSGTMMQITGPDIAAQSVTASQIVTGSLTGDVFAGQLILGSTISTGATDDNGNVVGARVDLGPLGLFVYDSAGNAITGFPNDPATDNFVTGTFDMLKANVRDNFTMNGVNNALAASSRITLGKGVSPPTSAPTIAFTYDTVQLDVTTRVPSNGGSNTDYNLGTFALDPSQITSMCWDQVYTCWQVAQQRSDGWRLWRFNADGSLRLNPLGTAIWCDDFRNQTHVTVSRGGWIQKWTDGKWYVWDTVVGGGRWGIVPAGWIIDGSPADPFCAFDESGNTLMICQGNTYSADTFQVRRVHTVPYVGGVIQNLVNDSTTNGPLTTQRSGDITGVIYTAADFGGPRYVVGSTAYTRIHVWTPSTRYNGATNFAEWDSSGTAKAMGYDGTNFWTVGATGKMTKYGSWTWPTEPSTTYVGMSIFDSRTGGDPANPWPGQSAGQHETSVGTLTSVNAPRRAKMTLTLPKTNDSGGVDDGDQWRVYWARTGGTVPTGSAMKLAGTAGSPTVTTSLTLIGDPTGAAPPGGIAGQVGASSNFPAGNPATLVSAGLDASSLPIVSIAGDGSGRIGSMTWNTKGDMTTAVGPPGEVKMYAGTTAPTGWMLCDGSEVSRTVYATLFAVIGTRFGTGNGTTTFNLPDMRSRLPLGVGAIAVVGQTEAGIPGSITGTPPAEDSGRASRWSHSHSHSTDSIGSGHTHTIPGQAADGAPASGGTAASSVPRNSQYGGHAHGGDTGSGGSGHSHGVSTNSGIGVGTVHASTALNYIIKT